MPSSSASPRRPNLLVTLTIFLVGAGPVLQAEILPDLRSSVIVAFESEYVFRGEKRAGESIQPSLEMGYPVGPGDLFFGVWASRELRSDPFEEVDFYAGYQLPLTPIFYLNGGFTYYWFPGHDYFTVAQEEASIGVFADLPLSPSAVLFYNFELEQILLEISIYENFWMTRKFGFEGGLVLGGGYAGNGLAEDGGDPEEGAIGYAVTYGNLVYSFTEDVRGSLGIRYSGRQDDGFYDFLYWGASISIWFE